MSLALAVTMIVTFDVALLGVLAFVMSQARHLSPHAHPERRPARDYVVAVRTRDRSRPRPRAVTA